MQSKEQLAAIFEALAFAADKHRLQRRKDAEASPYINHPITVARILVEEGGITDLDAVRAAVLHDTVEDTETTEAELRERFGDRVAYLVMAVTDDKKLAKAERKRLQIEHAAALPDHAKAIKLADKTANVRDVLADPPAEWSVERRREYLEWAQAVVDGLRGVHPGLERAFDRAVAGEG